MTVTCCWFSRHPPLEAQKQALEKLFPGYRLLLDGDVFKDVDDIVDRLDNVQRLYPGTILELVIVAPLSLIQKVIAKGIHPLYPVMRDVISDHTAAHDWYLHSGDSSILPQIVAKSAEYYRTHTDSCVLAPRGRVLEFVRFRRLVGIHFEFEDFDNDQSISMKGKA